MNAAPSVYLIPCFLDEESLETIPAYVLESVKACQVFFVENERSARRYLKRLWRGMEIDQYEWFAIHKAEESVSSQFLQKLKEQKTIGIISEAGCPGIADPGQLLVSVAQQQGFLVKPLVGPSSILLALMASGMNGQQFRFNGYLPIDAGERIKKIRELEEAAHGVTQLFIETPYRNNQLLDAMLKTCKGHTRLCIAVDITGKGESIITKTVSAWKQAVPDLNKRTAIFLMET